MYIGWPLNKYMMMMMMMRVSLRIFFSNVGSVRLVLGCTHVIAEGHRLGKFFLFYYLLSTHSIYYVSIVIQQQQKFLNYLSIIISNGYFSRCCKLRRGVGVGGGGWYFIWLIFVTSPSLPPPIFFQGGRINFVWNNERTETLEIMIKRCQVW